MDKFLLNADPPSRNIMELNADNGVGGDGSGDYDNDYMYHRKSSEQCAVKCIAHIIQI
jgi:hypothetical protein